MDKLRNALSEEEIIEQARKQLDEPVDSVLDACEAFYMHGFSDEADGDMDSSIGHFYRVHRWIVVTDSQGFHSLETYDTENEAEKAFDGYSDDFTRWDDQE